MEIKRIYPFKYSLINSFILTHIPTIHQPACSLYFLYNPYNNYETDTVIPLSKMKTLRLREYLNHKFSLKLNLEFMIFPMK